MKADLKRASLLVLLALGACNQTASDESPLSSPGSQVALYAAGVAAGFDPTGLSARATAIPYHAAAIERARKQQAMLEEQQRAAEEMYREFGHTSAEPRKTAKSQPVGSSRPAAATAAE